MSETTNTNYPIQFINGGDDINKLFTKKYDGTLNYPNKPGTLYFFEDGGIVWDSSDTKRVIIANSQIRKQSLNTSDIQPFSITNEWTTCNDNITSFFNDTNDQCNTYVIQICFIADNQDITDIWIDNEGTNTYHLSESLCFSGIFSITNYVTTQSAQLHAQEILLQCQPTTHDDQYPTPLLFARLIKNTNTLEFQLQLKTDVAKINTRKGYIKLRKLI